MVYSKKLSDESLKTIDSNTEISMSKLNSTEFQYTMLPYENNGDDEFKN